MGGEGGEGERGSSGVYVRERGGKGTAKYERGHWWGGLSADGRGENTDAMKVARMSLIQWGVREVCLLHRATTLGLSALAGKEDPVAIAQKEASFAQASGLLSGERKESRNPWKVAGKIMRLERRAELEAKPLM